MKKSKLRIVSVLLAAVMVLSCVPLSFYAAETEPETPVTDTEKTPDFIKDCKTGDIIKFGSYPQTEVDDEALIAALEKENKSWVSYNYYSGDGVMTGGGMAPSDYMQYSDFEYESQLYRAVKFTKFRPQYTFESNEAEEVLTYQDDNGYECGKTYYFKYEPLEWRVLDPASGLVMCSKVIDAQAFNDFFVYAKDESGEGNDIFWSNDEHTVRADDYTKSSVRYWLDNSFLTEAFSALELSKLEETTLENKKYDSEEAYEQSKDEVFLLSYDDVVNEAYGFNKTGSEEDANRLLTTTDYAKSQGVKTQAGVENNGWTLRTSNENGSVMAVFSSGSANSVVNVYSAFGGIVPAMTINPEKSITRAEKGDLDKDGKVNAGDALLILQHTVGISELKDELRLSADIDNDKIINSSDALLVLQYSVGLISGFGYFPDLDNIYSLNSTDKAEVLEYYKKIAQINADKELSPSYKITAKNFGETLAAGMAGKIEALAQAAIDEKMSAGVPFPGKAEQITADDWSSAEAVDEGDCTVISVKVNNQADGACGRSIGVTDSFENTLKAVSGLTVESVDAKITYKDPVINIKVDNKTGSIIKDECTWSCTADIQISSFKGTVDSTPVEIKNARVIVDCKFVFDKEKTPENPPEEPAAKYALESTDKDEVLEYYKTISALNAEKKFSRTLSLVSINCGEGTDPFIETAIKSYAGPAVEKGNASDAPYPGKPDSITADDWESAEAVNDGKYTTLTINVAPQEDGADAKQFDGPCGRSIGVIEGALDLLNGITGLTVESVDFKINYNTPVITVKVDNETGEIIKDGCSWSYTANLQVAAFKGNLIKDIEIKNASAMIDYKITY